MREIQLKMLQKAISILAALPVKFAIKCDDGTIHGTLPVVEDKPRKTMSCRVMPSIEESFASIGYEQKVRDMQVGDVICLPYTSYYNRKRLASSVASYCNRIHGAGTCVSTVTDTGVEALRVV